MRRFFDYLAVSMALIALSLHLPSTVSSPARGDVRKVPRFDHIVVVMMENKDYTAIIGNIGEAPYINSLASTGALLTNFVALGHPSQPNYLALYAGSTLGVTDNKHYAKQSPTLATVLIGAGKTFLGYVEQSSTSRAHNPWETFPEGAAVGRDFATFPASNFADLPTVAFVIPNLDHDMHDGSIRSGDAWLQVHFESYARWALANNSLLIVHWDENHSGDINRIASIFFGAHVKPGPFEVRLGHYNVLRTILAAHELRAPNEAAAAETIDVFE